MRQAASDQALVVRAAHPSGYVFLSEATACGDVNLRCWTRLQSYDHGATWTRVRDSVGVGIHTADVSAFPEVLVGGPMGVFRSRDAGHSWTLIRRQIQDASFAYNGFRTISRWGRDTLLVANNFADSQNKQASEFWYSTDDGRSWRWSYWGQQGGYMLAVLTGPAEPVVFFERNFFHSEPYPPPQWRFRQIWDLSATTPSPTAVLRLVRGPVRAGQRPVLYAGFGGISFSAPHPGPAVARSRDGGRSWAVLPSQPAAGIITDMAINARGTLAVAVQGAGLHVSDDEGESWRRLPAPALGDSVSSLALTDDGTVYAVRNYRTLYRSRTGLLATSAEAAPVRTGTALTVRPSVVRAGASVRIALTNAGVEDARVEVVDALGRIVWQGRAGSSVAEVTTGGWAAGLYAARVSAEVGAAPARVARFVVVR